MSRRHTREEDQTEEMRHGARDSEKANGAGAPGAREVTMINGFRGYVPSDKAHYASGTGQEHASEENQMEGLQGDYRQVSFGQPFSADDLVRAMRQSTLKPSAVQA